MNRNAGCLTKESASKLTERASMWADLIKKPKEVPVSFSFKENCGDEAAERIFKEDAIRTFKSEKRRSEMRAVLRALWGEIGDYHQGQGYVVSFLLLFLPKEEVAEICMNLYRQDRYMPRYWHAAPADFVRDARVFRKLMKKLHPEVETHVSSKVVPEAYASKWFVGLCVHVLPFAFLLDFLELFFQEGYPALFRFALALVEVLKCDILSASDVSKVLQALRLDAAVYPDPPSTKASSKKEEEGRGVEFPFRDIVERARSNEGVLKDVDLGSLRAEAVEEMAEEARKREERMKAMEDDDDDEIVFSDEEEN